MPETPAEIDAHFDSLGIMSLSAEDGSALGVELFACNSCGSVIAVRQKHWEVHQAIPGIEMQP